MSVLFRLLHYVKPSLRWAVLAVAMLMIAIVIDLIAPWLLKQVFDVGIANKDTGATLWFTAGLLIVQLFKSGASFVQGYSQEKVGQNVVYKLREDLYAHLQRLSFGYYDKAKTGQLMSRMTGDIDAVKNFIGFGALNMAGGMLTFAGTLGFMLWLQWKLTLISLISIPLILLALWQFNRKVGPAWGQIREQMGRLTSTLQENISGIRVVKAFAREGTEKSKFAARNEQNFETNMKRAMLEARAFPLMGFYGGITFLIMIWLGAYFVASGEMTLGTFMAFQWYVWGLIWPLNMLGWLINIYQQAVKAAPRVFEIVDTSTEIASPAGGGASADSITGAVEYRDVRFYFDDQNRETDTPILDGIDLQVRQGEVIAILGATGSGKSSLTALLSRFYDASAGQVLLDGIDVKDYDLDGLRRKIGIVPQETFLFSATIRDNIAYGRPDASRETIEEAARKAQIHDFIETLPRGYDTLVGERGIGLSGGQRQRVALARAILTDPPILVLDEATASVDTATESAIHESLLEVMKDRTTFIIAQRLSTIRRADRVLVLEDGRIAQNGTHKELFRQEGFFRSLFSLQDEAYAMRQGGREE